MIAIYSRVSTEEQAISGYSIGHQIDECRKKASSNEVLIYKDEGISGEILERPSLSRMREDIQKGIINEIICYDPDRLSRKLMHQLLLDDEFRKKGVRLHFVNGEYANTPEGQLFFSMRGAISEFEKEKIKQRTKGGKVKKAKNGKVLGAYGLYGYDYDKVKETYVINEEQAKVVRMIFDYFTEPTSPFKGMNSIAKHLTEIGLPTAKNKGIWHRNVVRQILANESYTGKHAHNKYNDEGGYVRVQSGGKREQKIRDKSEWIYVDIPSIISEEQYNIAQELLSQSRRRFAKESLHSYLLSGLIRCKDCGNTMVGRQSTWWGEKLGIYSDIKNTAGAKNKGCGNQIKVNKLDEFVWKHALDLINNPEKLVQYEDSDKSLTFYEKDLENIEKKLERNKKGRQQLLKLVAISDEDLDLTEIKVQLEEMQQNQKSLQTQYNQIKEKMKADNNREVNMSMMQQAIEIYLETKELDFKAKQTIIRTMFKQIYVPKDHDNEEIDIVTF